MGYSVNRFFTDYLFSSSQLNSEHQAAYNDLQIALNDMNNISDDDFESARDSYLSHVEQGFQNAVDAVLSQPEVANNTSASNWWQEFERSPVCPAIVGAIAGNYVCDREHTQEFINRGNEEISKLTDELAKGTINTVLEPPIVPGTPKAAGNNALIILCNIIANWDGIKSGVAGIKDWIASYFDAATQRMASPIVFDLDGDGIETVGMVRQYAATPGGTFTPSGDDPILFDHNGDGVKTNTGWIGSDDGILVMDRNGNGIIDNGRELFGNFTPLYGGGTAVDGFAALAQEDTNQDGVVNHLDANWEKLKVWQDVNQDGISQAEELHTLEALGITGINVGKTNTTQNLSNGNRIIGTGTFTRADGTTGNMADVWFQADTFTREFTDSIPVSEEVSSLPQMTGSGLVRDLQEAAVRPLKSIHMLRCAAVLGVATYTKSTPHFCGFARLASERI